jgi:MFS family permease
MRGRTVSPRQVLVPLALAQFICSFAGSNMNVMINDISEDLDTSVQGVQATITVFLLTMAALMIVGSKLTDRWGRKRCFILGLAIYGVGAVMSAIAPGLGVLFVGNSLFEGVGSALLIPPVYILTTMVFTDVMSRARAFGLISGMGGVGAAAGPLIGGLITTAISWRVAFLFQALVIATILFLSRPITDPVEPDPTRPFDMTGAILSAAGLFFIVIGILQTENSILLMAVFLAVGAGFVLWFLFHIKSAERAGKEPLLSTSLFRNRASNLGLVTQHVQWFMLLGTAFVVSVFLQVVRDYSAIETGVVFTAATAGLLVPSLAAERLAKKYAQRTLIIAGFVVAIAGLVLLLGPVKVSSNVLTFLPGLLLIGLGTGVMMTPSVNVVQSAFPEEQQGEISGLSRSVSNLGSSLGTAIAGTVLIAAVARGNGAYVAAMIVLAGFGLIGLAAAWFLPGTLRNSGAESLGGPT